MQEDHLSQIYDTSGAINLSILINEAYLSNVAYLSERRKAERR
ncbi:hypothetical protein SAMN06298214_0018 [Bacteroidales bacterium WCE2004]|nr:hypothetical protein SAMN06298214_0018 [Bacteroidales bacterium WCE2004]